MIIFLHVQRESVTEVVDVDAIMSAHDYHRIIDEYRIPDGLIRLIVTYRGGINWPMVDSAAVNAAIANGIRGWQVERISSKARRAAAAGKREK